jgi:Kinetochore complex Sim4 subunit Fta1
MAPQTYPLYSTSFVMHRLSPLFLGAIHLDESTLRQYASQFRDVLTGEILRGVRVGLATDDDTLARVGALRSVFWRFLGNEEDWRPVADEEAQGHNDTTGFEQSYVGILVEITYEKAIYCAILLRDMEKENEADFAHYPLLLTRMPAAFRQTFLDFLTANFDTRASVMKISPQFMTEMLEKYLSDITTSENGFQDVTPANQAIKSIIKDVSITISFDIPGGSSALKTMDVTIPKDDVWLMISRGQKLQQINQLDANSKEIDHPFTTALSHYIAGHLALSLESIHVNISKIACGAFVVGIEGRIKIFPPRDEDDIQRSATKALVESLIKFMQGRKRLAQTEPLS